MSFRVRFTEDAREDFQRLYDWLLQQADGDFTVAERALQAIGDGVTVLDEPAEQALALALSRFGEVVAEVAVSLQPHKLCTYLFDTATALSTFYEQCPVLKSEGEVRTSRLAICVATRTVLGKGLDLLGIVAPERM